MTFKLGMTGGVTVALSVSRLVEDFQEVTWRLKTSSYTVLLTYLFIVYLLNLIEIEKNMKIKYKIQDENRVLHPCPIPQRSGAMQGKVGTMIFCYPYSDVERLVLLGPSLVPVKYTIGRPAFRITFTPEPAIF